VCLISVYWPDRAKGHFGSDVAAPYVKEVLEDTLAYWNVAPDKDPSTTTKDKEDGGRRND
jgi:hypothetical protein